MPLPYFTVHVFGFNSFIFCGKELKICCDMADMLVPVSNNAVVVHCWTVMWYIALIPSKEFSAITMAISVNSQSDVDHIKLEYLVKGAQ